MAVLEIDGDTASVSPVAKRRKLGGLFLCAVAWILLIGLAAVFAAVLPIASPTDMDMLGKRALPSAEHLLGTDSLGRDILSRLIYGARVSLTVGLLSSVIGVTIGGALGMLAGYFRGRLETLTVGGVDVLLAFPPLVFLLAVLAYLGQTVLNITLVIGVLSIPAFTRVARAVTLSLSEREFVVAARALGAGAALLFYNQKNMRGAKIAGSAGAALMLFAALLFATRPDAHAALDAVGGDTADTAKPDGAKLAEGNYLCTIRPDRSRITVSSTTDVPVAIAANGCVNDRTQYAMGADGHWQRILVPNEEATVTVASIDPAAKDYRVDRYLLDADTMKLAREARAGITLKACTTDADALAGLATQQEAIRAVLPASPNERLVYQCQKAAAGVGAKPAP